MQTGQAAVFNSKSEIGVEAGVGLEPNSTLVGRFAIPEPVGLELISINPNDRSVGVTDFVEGLISTYSPSDYQGPEDAIDGASGGGGFIHLWANGTIYSYPGRMTDEPLVYQPEPLVAVPGVAPSLRVVPAPDGERAWLVQAGVDGGPTRVELVNLVEVMVTRLGSFVVEGAWLPVGVTDAGLILNSKEGPSQTVLVDFGGSVSKPIDGETISVGWNAAALVRPDGSLVLTDASLGSPSQVAKPGSGIWVSVGVPPIPADSPPSPTGSDALLVALVEESELSPWSVGSLVVVDQSGSASIVHSLEEGPRIAGWSRAGDWAVLVEDSAVTLISLAGGKPVNLGDVVPEDHWVLTLG